MKASSLSPGVSGLALAALAGGVSAACFGLALMKAETLLIFLAYLAAVPLFAAGLGAGNAVGVVAAFIGTAGLFVAQSANTAVVYALINAIPAIVLILMALRYRVGMDGKIYWYPEGELLTAITLYPCVLFVLISALTSGQEGGLLALTTQFINEAFEPLKSQIDADTVIKLTAALAIITRLLPAIIGCSWIFIMMISMVVAQTLLERGRHNLRSAFALRALHIPNWLIFAVAGAGLMSTMAPPPYDYLGTNLGIMLGVPFFFTGLAVVHAYADSQRASMTILIVFYLLLSLFPALALLAALLGAIDQWVNFRQLFVRRIDKSV